MLSGTLIKAFLDKFSSAPTFAGVGADVTSQIVSKDRLFYFEGKEVVFASQSDILNCPDKFHQLLEGW